MTRWTIRNVTPKAVRAVQALQSETGASLGDIVSACIEAGIDDARRRLEDQEDDLGNQIRDIRDSLTRMRYVVTTLPTHRETAPFLPTRRRS
jgi:hypothetical protein